MDNDLQNKSLTYHSRPPAGKIGTRVTKSCRTQEDLSLAYSPGVAAPCRRISDNPEEVWTYTGKANSVGVVSDGSAVLGLGDIGPDASLPVMEGKAVLFKYFADIDAVPLCLNPGTEPHSPKDTTAEELIHLIQAVEPSYGGINLEDIGSPQCFTVEQKLKDQMGIPVFHDDQHGTAIISLAGVLNALQIVGKQLGQAKIVVNGAGAAGIACTDFYIAAGAKPENVIICDSKGVINKKRREKLSPQKARLASDTSAATLEEALCDADVFLGLSVKDCVTQEMVRSMAPDPIIFAMANPDPEITPASAVEAGAAVVGTGRTDYPNQVNNVLGFPGIFRGALDARASMITEDMKVAAAKALAELTSERIEGYPRDVLTKAYPQDAAEGLFDGENPLNAKYTIPKPFDPRVVPRVARRVFEAACACGAATAAQPTDMQNYEEEVFRRTCTSDAQ